MFISLIGKFGFCATSLDISLSKLKGINFHFAYLCTNNVQLSYIKNPS